MKNRWKEIIFIVFAITIFVNLVSCNYGEEQKGGVTLEVTLVDKGTGGAFFQDSEANLYSISKDTLEEYLDFNTLLEGHIITVYYSGGLQEMYPYVFVKIYDIKIGK